MAFSKSIGFKAALAGSCFFLLQFILSSCNAHLSSENKYDLITFEAMDTFMSLKSYGKKAVKADLLAKEEIKKIEKIISTTDSESEVFKINMGSSSYNEFLLSDSTAALLNFSLSIANETDGAFNVFLFPITKEWGFTTKNYKVPDSARIQELLPLTNYKNAILSDNLLTIKNGMQLDFGGIGKGYSGDIALKILKDNGVTSAIIDLGGNIQVLGSKPDGSSWNIGLRNPFEEASEPVLSLKINDSAVITSGGYERYFTGDDGKKYIHIFDSKTGYPAGDELVSVTIICREGKLGDALSTALFAMGKEKALAFWKNCKLYNFDMILILNDKSIVYTKSLEEKISLLFEFSDIKIEEK